MLTVDQALQLVLDQVQAIAPRKVDLHDALGLVLAEEVASDIDSPPHDKSIVDGYALQAASASQPGCVLAVFEEVTAGAMPTKSIQPGAATRIMTGAPIPTGADAVVMVEQTSPAGDDRVRIDAPLVKSGQNIVRRAASLARGQMVLTAGTRLRGIELGVLAEVGRSKVVVTSQPSLAVVATGNELVPCDQVPGPGQIRNSNSSLLLGLARQAGASSITLGLARDDVASLRTVLGEALSSQVVVVSGGVSAGVLDLVPRVLAELGVEQVFHKVNLKPGKPLWFGVKRHAESEQQTLVFGLPGNPVSTLVCFELFVRPAIQRLSGREPKSLARSSAILTKDHPQRGERPTYWPAKFLGDVPLDCLSSELRTPFNAIIGFAEILEQLDVLTEQQRKYATAIQQSGNLLLLMINDALDAAKNISVQNPEYSGGPRSIVTPLPWKGSGDLATLAGANCLAYFPPGERLFKAGETIEVLHLP